MIDAPGPFSPLALDALRPMPARPSFEGIVADVLGNAAGLDPQLAGAAQVAGDSDYAGDDGSDTEIAAAIDDALLSPGADVPLTLGDALDAGVNVETLHDSVSNVLPPADTPVEFSYDQPQEPPQLTPSPGATTAPEPAAEGSES